MTRRWSRSFSTVSYTIHPSSEEELPGELEEPMTRAMLPALAEQKPKTYDLVETAPERYICLICSSLQEQAVLVSCCGQHFCESCLKKWYRQQGKRCPHCRQMGVTHLLNKERIRDINELQVYCSNKTEGCTWESDLGCLDEHLKTKCGYVQVDCPKKCKMRMSRKELSKHIEESCLCRDYNCEHCGLVGTYHTITGECGEFGPCKLHGNGHYSECQSFPIQCPNQCSETVKRKDLAAHREVCPLEPVECSFSEVGCTEKIARKDLDNHLATGDHHHLVLTMTAFKELKAELKQSRQEVKELKQKVEEFFLKQNMKYSPQRVLPAVHNQMPEMCYKLSTVVIPSVCCCCFD